MPSLRAAAVTGLLLSLAACSHSVTARNLDDGSEIRVIVHLISQTVTVLLPDGETAAGSFSSLTTQSIGEGSLFFGINVAALLGRNIGSERFHGHVRAFGDRGTRLEAVVSLGWTGHGFGFARTGDGREFRIAF